MRDFGMINRERNRRNFFIASIIVRTLSSPTVTPGKKFVDINKFGNPVHEMEVYQIGNNQQIISRGTNSLSKKMKI